VANEYLTLDKKMNKIPDSLTTTTSGIAGFIGSNFKTETEKIRAVFYWTAANISYDVPNRNEPNYLDAPEVKIANALKSRKGVCIHYAEIFNDIANKAGIKTYIIPGYTKQAGKVDAISHAWCASRVDGKWFLFDPTWGSGYVNGKTFTKKLNNAYFKVEPKKLITSHMPFDYLWQFLNSPWTNQEFYDGKEDVKKAKVNFDYQTEIEAYEKLSEGDKAFQAAARIQKNGLKNNLISEEYDSLKKQFTALNQNKNVEKLNVTIANYNEAISFLNDFVMYRFKKFKPTVADDELKNMLQNIKDRFTKCKNDIYEVGSVGEENKGLLFNLKSNINLNMIEVEKQETFLKEYLSKGLIGRKIMLASQR